MPIDYYRDNYRYDFVQEKVIDVGYGVWKCA